VTPAAPAAVVDAHVHFWDPSVLSYPWLEDVPALNGPRLPPDFRAAHVDVPVVGIVVVEANPHPSRGIDEARWAARLARTEPGIAAIVAFVDLLDAGRDARIDRVVEVPGVRGVRHNIQGNAPGFCLQPGFVAGVREVGRRGLVFDLCATHDQLDEVVELVRRCPDTRFVLDHCGKPAVGAGLLDPWRRHVRELAEAGAVWCKLSGLLTEAGPGGWRDEDLLPYAEHVAEWFGAERLFYGSDWPVLTLAERPSEWYPFTRRFTREWSAEQADRFFRGNAAHVYGIQPP
jgi:L-fuconolactonase